MLWGGPQILADGSRQTHSSAAHVQPPLHFCVPIGTLCGTLTSGLCSGLAIHPYGPSGQCLISMRSICIVWYYSDKILCSFSCASFTLSQTCPSFILPLLLHWNCFRTLGNIFLGFRSVHLAADSTLLIILSSLSLADLFYSIFRATILACAWLRECESD